MSIGAIAASGVSGATPVRHSVWGNTTPPGSFSLYDDSLNIRLGMVYYRVGNTPISSTSKVVGGRLWCPPGVTLPTSVRMMCYVGFTGSTEHPPAVHLLTDPSELTVDAGTSGPDGDVVVPITVPSSTGGWQEAVFPTPVSIPDPGKPILIAYKFPPASSKYLAGSGGRPGFANNFVAASDGSNIYWSEQPALDSSSNWLFDAGYYRYIDQAPGYIGNSVSYGVDILVEE